MARKDDPVFNVKFVQLVESQPCLWNSTLPAYSKKEEIQKSWQAVANDTKDSVRNCRERWRTIRSSFLRSLKLSRTTTGRGKRKYYLSKYMQFLLPYTKTRLRRDSNPTALRTAVVMQPMTRINHMPFPLPVVSSDNTKDSTASEAAIADEDGVVSLQENSHRQQLQPRLAAFSAEASTNTTIKTEQGADQQQEVQQPQRQEQKPPQQQHNAIGGGTVANPVNGFLSESSQPYCSSAVDLTEFAEWIKTKNHEQLRHCLLPSTPSPTSVDANQSFLNSLYPYLKEMTGKQNRRFRQKVVALVDAILDDAD